MVNDTLVLDASSSFDNIDLYNRNFTYKWKCPQQFNSSNFCSNNTNILKLTSQQRNILNINIPG